MGTPCRSSLGPRCPSILLRCGSSWPESPALHGISEDLCELHASLHAFRAIVREMELKTYSTRLRVFSAERIVRMVEESY
jgi:hypothetical protein